MSWWTRRNVAVSASLLAKSNQLIQHKVVVQARGQQVLKHIEAHFSKQDLSNEKCIHFFINGQLDTDCLTNGQLDTSFPKHGKKDIIFPTELFNGHTIV